MLDYMENNNFRDEIKDFCNKTKNDPYLEEIDAMTEDEFRDYEKFFKDYAEHEDPYARDNPNVYVEALTLYRERVEETGMTDELDENTIHPLVEKF